MAVQPFHWDDLGRFKRDPRFIAHYPPDVRSFFSPDDDVPAVVAARGVGNSIAIGTSYKHAISHLKIVIVDGIYTVKGSTNWSLGGEHDQDNELTVTNSAVIAAEARAVLDRNHDFMLKQMAKKAARARFKPVAKAGGKAA